MDRYVVALEGLNDETMDCALSNLAWPVNVEWPYRHCWHRILQVVVVRQVFGSKLAHSVGPTSLAYRTQAGDIPFAHLVGIDPKDFAGGKIDKALQVRTFSRRLQHVDRSEDVHLHRRHGHAKNGIHASDRRKVNDVVGAFRSTANRISIEHIPFCPDEVPV